MDAIRALIAQHRAITSLFGDAAQETRRRPRSTVVSRIAEELIAHLAAEETVFYPAVRPIFAEAGDASACTRGDPLLLRVALRRVLEGKVGDATFAERLGALQSLFVQHVKEEELELFPRVRGALTQAERDALGAEIVASRPPVWIVTSERDWRPRAQEDWAGSRICLPGR